MQFNKLFFPSPKSSYTKVSISLLKDVELLQIPSGDQITCLNCSMIFCFQQNQKGAPQQRQVPVLLVKHHRFAEQKHNKYIIFFHSNSEDIYNAYEYLYPITIAYNVNLILVEYPGYGIYMNQSASAEIVSQDAITVFEYFISKRRLRQEDIIVMGRSIGCGPACLLASKFNPAGLVTISAYTSLTDIAEGLIGSVLSKLIEERFNNLKIITQVKCPMLVIHGQKDNLINQEHSKKLISIAKSKFKQYHFSENMTHNKFDIQEDIIQPLKYLFEKINFARENTIIYIQRTSIQI